jgi:hypothetical protein
VASRVLVLVPLCAVALAGCKTPSQPEPQPPAAAPSIGWNTSAQEPLPEEINPDRFRKVCRRIAKLNDKTPTAEDIDGCAGAARDAWQLDPKQFDAQERCFFEHDQLAEAEACASDVPETEPPLDLAIEARTRRLCQHLVDLAEQDGVSLINDLEDCVASSVEERENDPATFDRWADCVLGASSLQDSIECESPAP